MSPADRPVFPPWMRRLDPLLAAAGRNALFRRVVLGGRARPMAAGRRAQLMVLDLILLALGALAVICFLRCLWYGAGPLLVMAALLVGVVSVVAWVAVWRWRHGLSGDSVYLRARRPSRLRNLQPARRAEVFQAMYLELMMRGWFVILGIALIPAAIMGLVLSQSSGSPWAVAMAMCIGIYASFEFARVGFVVTVQLAGSLLCRTRLVHVNRGAAWSHYREVHPAVLGCAFLILFMLSPLQFTRFSFLEGDAAILRFALLPLVLGIAARLMVPSAVRGAMERTHTIVQEGSAEAEPTMTNTRPIRPNPPRGLIPATDRTDLTDRTDRPH